MVRLGYLAGTVSLTQDTQTHGLCPPLNFPLSLIKTESEFRTAEERIMDMTNVTISRGK